MSEKKRAVVAYVPALHKGYLDFFKRYGGGPLYILGENFVREHPRMDRDIRALSPADVKRAIKALGIFSCVEVLTEKNLQKLNAGSSQDFVCESASKATCEYAHANRPCDDQKIVLPDEDISRSFAEKHLAGRRVEFIPVFLRWDRQISVKEAEIPPDRVISENELDRELMAAAETESQKSPDWWRRVGAVIVGSGGATKSGEPRLAGRKILLTAHNKHLPSEYSAGAFGDPRSNFDAGEKIELSKAIHAEAALVAEAARRGLALDGASLYVTTFPCPVCAKSIAAAGIKKVYYKKGYSLLDAEEILRVHGVEIVLVK